MHGVSQAAQGARLVRDTLLLPPDCAPGKRLTTFSLRGGEPLPGGEGDRGKKGLGESQYDWCRGVCGISMPDTYAADAFLQLLGITCCASRPSHCRLVIPPLAIRQAKDENCLTAFDVSL